MYWALIACVDFQHLIYAFNQLHRQTHGLSSTGPLLNDPCSITGPKFTPVSSRSFFVKYHSASTLFFLPCWRHFPHITHTHTPGVIKDGKSSSVILGFLGLFGWLLLANQSVLYCPPTHAHSTNVTSLLGKPPLMTSGWRGLVMITVWKHKLIVDITLPGTRSHTYSTTHAQNIRQCHWQGKRWKVWKASGSHR